MGHQGDRQGRSLGVEETQGRSLGVEETQGRRSQPKQIVIEAIKFVIASETLHQQGNTFTPPYSSGSDHRKLLHPMILSILIVCFTIPHPFPIIPWVLHK